MRVELIPALSDNYNFLVIDEASGRAAAVDPSSAEPILEKARAEGVTLTQLWITHHHWDHVGGVEGIVAALGGVEVFGSVYDLQNGRVPHQTRALSEGDSFEFGDRTVRVLDVPGHTLGHIAYVAGEHLFCGDALFVGGCGRVFEGTMGMMKDSLAKLRHLDDDTRIYCAHEYTVKNLEYAASVEPGSVDVARALEEARVRREQGRSTVPGTIGRERRTNPFMRFDVPGIAKGRDEIAAFAALREGKDRF